ncbi:MAG: dUTP diphosphatase [Acidaminococcaceae bacterium]
MRVRGFEKVAEYANFDFLLPMRKTKCSAGYDFYLPEDITLPPGQVTLVPTGVKAYMQENEYLGMHLRSSIAMKMCLTMINNQGIIDADYYNNKDNEGHIKLLVYNLNDHEVTLQKGERIAQGIFYNYMLADADVEIQKETRSGGFGSTK